MAGGNLSSDNDDGLISAINVTPMVDIVLVLLVIFMITAPVIYQSAIKVQLPKASSGEKPQKSQFNFVVTKDSEVLWNSEKLGWAEIEDKLKGVSESDKDAPVSISADDKAYHGQVIHLMDLLQKAGLKKFALNVEKVIKK